MSIALLVITDGRRDCIQQTISSAYQMLEGPITHHLIYNDSGDPAYEFWLRHMYAKTFKIHNSSRRRGFGGAIQAAWRILGRLPIQYVFHLEDDFTFRRPVLLDRMVQVLSDNPYLVQLALRRQPWNFLEAEAGGVVELHPDAYTEMSAGDSIWLEHRLFFTTNPSLYRVELCDKTWPAAGQSEGRFTHELLADPEIQFGYWGSRDSGEWVHHIGSTRAGERY